LINKNIIIFAKTIAIGILGGIVFNFFLLPLPWMLGAAFSVAIFALSGINVNIKRSFRAPFIGITGVWLGSYFQSSILNDLNVWLISLLFLIVYVPFAHFISYYILIKFRKINKPEAFFIGSPGGLLEMTLGAEECKADAKKVSLIHITRIFLTVMLIPNLILLFFPGSFEREPIWPNFEGNFLHVIAFFIIIPVGHYFGKKFNFPGYQLFGPLIISAILHMIGFFQLNANITFLIISQLIIVSFFGCNMNGTTWKVAGSYLIDALFVVFSLTLSFVPFIFVIKLLTSIKIEAMVLAFSPGGVNEMGLLASFINIEPAYVLTHHLLRLCTVLFLLIFAKKYLYPKFKKLLT
jgi:uncharacterized protein